MAFARKDKEWQNRWSGAIAMKPVASLTLVGISWSHLWACFEVSLKQEWQDKLERRQKSS